jgi:hypothetical protein
MKSKQLANVLIKILGLFVIVHGVPAAITASISMLRMRGVASQQVYWTYPFSSVLLVVFGIALILKSRDIAAFLFKEEDE